VRPSGRTASIFSLYFSFLFKNHYQQYDKQKQYLSAEIEAKKKQLEMAIILKREEESKRQENSGRAQLNMHYAKTMELELNFLSPASQNRLKWAIGELLHLEKSGITDYSITYGFAQIVSCFIKFLPNKKSGTTSEITK
jgi:hypothetical protein